MAALPFGDGRGQVRLDGGGRGQGADDVAAALLEAAGEADLGGQGLLGVVAARMPAVRPPTPASSSIRSISAIRSGAPEAAHRGALRSQLGSGRAPDGTAHRRTESGAGAGRPLRAGRLLPELCCDEGFRSLDRPALGLEMTLVMARRQMWAFRQPNATRTGRQRRSCSERRASRARRRHTRCPRRRSRGRTC